MSRLEREKRKMRCRKEGAKREIKQMKEEMLKRKREGQQTAFVFINWMCERQQAGEEDQTMNRMRG